MLSFYGQDHRDGLAQEGFGRRHPANRLALDGR
jgi:hypothetical protein